MSNRIKVAGIIGVVLLAFAATPALVVPTDSADRPNDSRNSIEAQFSNSSALAAVLVRSCGECHSNTLTANWYTRVPPFSALMARAADEGRRSVNFSEWSEYPPEQQHAMLVASCTDATRGTMPIELYLRFRSDARLSSSDVDTICSAARPAAPKATTAAGPAGRVP